MEFAESTCPDLTQCDLFLQQDQSSLDQMLKDGNGNDVLTLTSLPPSPPFGGYDACGLEAEFDESLHYAGIQRKDPAYWSQSQASPDSMASDDIPSPLSEGMEDMMLQRDLPMTNNKAILNLLRQAEEDGSPPGPSELQGSDHQHQSRAKVLPDGGQECQSSTSSSTAAGNRSQKTSLGRSVTQPVVSSQMTPPMTGCLPVTRVGVDVLDTVTKKRGVKRKAVQVEEEKCGDDPVSRNQRNALAARENRLKKKKEWEYLKEQNSSLQKENRALNEEKQKSTETIAELEEQLSYYKSVLYNQSTLSNLLKSLNPTPHVSLRAFPLNTSQGRGNSAAGNQDMSGGVCLHVNGPSASLEFCSQCSLNAQSSFKS